MVVISVFLTLTLMLLVAPLAIAGVSRNISQDFTGTATMCDPNTDPEGYFVPGITKYVGPKDSEVNPNPDNPENRRDQISSGAIFFGVIDIDCFLEHLLNF